MQTLFGGLIGGAVALAGSTFSYWNKNRELDIRMVDVALTILSAKDDSTKSTHARRYALDLLDKYGGVPISYKAEWIQDKNGVPIGNWPVTSFNPYTGLQEGWDSKSKSDFVGPWVPEVLMSDILKEYLERKAQAEKDKITPVPN